MLEQQGLSREEATRQLKEFLITSNSEWMLCPSCARQATATLHNATSRATNQKATPQTIDDTPVTFVDLGFIVYMSALSSATKCTAEILSKLKPNYTKDEETKLQFDLSISFLAVAAKVIMALDRFSKTDKQRVLNNAVDHYFKDLAEYSADPSHAVDGTFFVKDPEEYLLFIKEIKNVPLKSARMEERLPSTTLNTIASIVFSKRLQEYQDLWNHDSSRQSQPNFFPQLPSRVYKHWVGKDLSGQDAFVFSPLLWSRQLTFYSTLYDEMRDIDLASQ